jgi:hypothetical protein
MEKERREALGEPEPELEEKREPVKKKPKKEPVKKASEENHNVSLDHDSNIYLRDDIIYLNLERPES